MFRLAALGLFVSLAPVAAAAECLDQPVPEYDAWKASVEACAAEDGWTLVEPALLPDQFKRGLAPAEAYADDEVARIEYEEWEQSLPD